MRNDKAKNSVDEPSPSPAKKSKTYKLSDDDLEMIVMGQKLSDKHINYAHELLRYQFPTLNLILHFLS